jgi:hypothetical protein
MLPAMVGQTIVFSRLSSGWRWDRRIVFSRLSSGRPGEGPDKTAKNLRSGVRSFRQRDCWRLRELARQMHRE